MMNQVLLDWTEEEKGLWCRADATSKYWVADIHSGKLSGGIHFYGEIFTIDSQYPEFIFSSDNLSEVKSVLDEKLKEYGCRLLDEQPELGLLI